MADFIRQGTGDGLVVETEINDSLNPPTSKAVKDRLDMPVMAINLKSTSASSLKVFAITVDDSGEITATEVTD